MKIVLSHTTAQEYWRGVSANLLAQPNPSQAFSTGGTAPREEQQLTIDSLSPYFCRPPIHLLVAKSLKANNTKAFTYHSRSTPLPVGSLAKIDKNTYVVSPELCLVQMASEIPFASLVALAYEFCGTYSILGTAHTKYQCRPITTTAKIQAYLSRIENTPGVKALRTALPYVLDNSASPMESALTIMLILPYRYGGYGFPKPQLNYLIHPNSHNINFLHKNYYSCDLYWENEKVAIEYDSDLYHTDPDQVYKDARRRTDLTGIDIAVFTVTAHQMRHLSEFDHHIRPIAKKLGKRIRPPKGFGVKQRLLYESLLSTQPSYEESL